MSQPIVTGQRPSWVPDSFAGRCKVWPVDRKVLLPYQVAWVRDGSRMKLCEKARQIGISLATAYSIATRTSTAEAKYDDWIASRDDVQAGLLIRDVRKVVAMLEPSAAAMGKRLLAKDDEGGSRSIRWANGRTTHSLSSNIDAQSGKSGRRILDEFALHRDPKRLYGIAQPGTAWGGSMDIISTHRGSGNYFAALVEEARAGGNPKKFSLHRVTIDDALQQGLLFKLQSRMEPSDVRLHMDEGDYQNHVRSECPDEASYLEEYCCVPADDESAFIDYELISRCEYPEGDGWRHSLAQLADQTDDLFLGVDIGRRKDLTVMWVLRKVGDVLHTVFTAELQRTSFDVQERMFNDIMGLPRLRRACVDETGIGMQFAESGVKRYGYRVEPITFTNGSKEWMAYALRTAFEKSALRIPNCIAVRSDIHSVRKEYTGAGSIRFAADSSNNGHADRFWALALAVNAANTAVNPGTMQVGTHGSLSMRASTRTERAVA